MAMTSGPRCSGQPDCLCGVCDPAFRDAVRADMAAATGADAGHPDGCCCPAPACVAEAARRKANNEAEWREIVGDLRRVAQLPPPEPPPPAPAARSLFDDAG